MTNQKIFSASLMCINWLNVKEDIEAITSLGLDYIHYDILDGNFANDFTMGSSIINSITEFSRLPGDYHLMVEEPRRLFDMVQFNERDIVTIHQECCKNLHRDLIYLKKMNIKVGVALSPATNIEVLEYIIDDLDHIILMTVDPGYMGQELVPQVFSKISNTRKLIEESSLNCTLAVDGNVNASNIKKMHDFGANFFVLGSTGLFTKKESLKDSFQKILSSFN